MALMMGRGGRGGMMPGMMMNPPIDRYYRENIHPMVFKIYGFHDDDAASFDTPSFRLVSLVLFKFSVVFVYFRGK